MISSSKFSLPLLQKFFSFDRETSYENNHHQKRFDNRSRPNKGFNKNGLTSSMRQYYILSKNKQHSLHFPCKQISNKEKKLSFFFLNVFFTFYLKKKYYFT